MAREGPGRSAVLSVAATVHQIRDRLAGMRPGKFIVLRSFFLNPETVVEKDRVVELSDPTLIQDLIEAGKITPADDQTKARVKVRQHAEWSAAKIEGGAPAGFVGWRG